MEHIKILTLKNFTPEVRNEYSRISTSSADINQYVPGLVLQDPQDQKKIEKIFKEAIVCAVYSDDGKIAGLIHAIREKSLFGFSGLNVAAFLAKKYRHKGLMNLAMKEFILIIFLTYT